MNKLIQQIYTHKTLYFLIILSAFLVFPRLGENALGVDEGVASFYSLTTLKFGYPANSDGINEVDYLMAMDGRQKIQPWFPYYVRALSLYIFGQNSFAARFPSALLAVLSVPLLYFLTLKINRNKEEAAIATLLFICSVPLLLYFRTARYISFEIPFTLLIIWFYFQMLEHKKWSARFYHILSHALSFYAYFLLRSFSGNNFTSACL